MEYGGITPIGVPEGWPMLVDEAVAAQQWIIIGSGIRGSKLLIPGSGGGDVAGRRDPGALDPVGLSGRPPVSEATR